VDDNTIDNPFTDPAYLAVSPAMSPPW